MGDVRGELATELDMLVKGLKIVTRCVTVDELVAAFWKFCTPTTCFIPTRDRRRVGIESLFSLRLADNTVAVRGLCIVRDVWDTGENPFGRPGIQVDVIRISDDTKSVYARMLAQRTAQIAAPAPPGETERVESRAAMRTVEMPPALPPELLPEASAEASNDCTIGEDLEATERARTEVDPPVELVPDAAPRSEIATLIGMTPPDTAAPRYVSNEPRAVKIMQPQRKTWWTRFATALRALLHWRPKRARQRHQREKIAALSREAIE